MSGAEEEEGDIRSALSDLSQAIAPTSMKTMRACKRCGLLKTIDQFIDEGCENCPFLDMVRNLLLSPNLAEMRSWILLIETISLFTALHCSW